MLERAERGYQRSSEGKRRSGGASKCGKPRVPVMLVEMGWWMLRWQTDCRLARAVSSRRERVHLRIYQAAEATEWGAGFGGAAKMNLARAEKGGIPPLNYSRSFSPRRGSLRAAHGNAMGLTRYKTVSPTRGAP